MNSTCSGFQAIGGNASPMLRRCSRVSKFSTTLTRCGLKRWPPDATVAVACAICNMVKVFWPCPMPSEIVSPAYHFCISFFL